MTTKNTNIGWSGTEMLGIIVIALGAALLAYSLYSYFSTPTISIPGGFNTTAFRGGNFTGRGGAGNVTRGAAFNRTGAAFVGAGGALGTSLLVRIGDILSGILALLLGVVLFKYGSLKKRIK